MPADAAPPPSHRPSLPLVELQGVTLRLGGRAVLTGVDLALRAGESWAILGANGSGKSSLLRLLRGELWPSAGRRTFHLDGRPEESPIGARERIGLVGPELQQEYVRRDWALRVEAVVRSGFTDSVWPPEEATPAQAARVAQVLEEPGVAALARRSILELSGGEARKALLARALVARPRLLLLDEPCHGLDAPSRAAFLALVSRVARSGTPVALATHRQGELVPEIERVAILPGGRVLAAGARAEVLRRHGRRPGAGPGLRPGPVPGAGPGPGANPAPERTLVVLEHADVRVGGRPVLHDLSWRVRAGERWGVVGPNGAGKSTLLRLVVGDEQAMPGGRVARLDLGERACVWDVKARVGLVSPELQARHRADLPAEVVVASGFTASIGATEAPTARQLAAAARCMARVGVAHLAGRGVHGLSYGELRKLLVARALVLDPELLVLDEPCDGLDPESRAALLAGVQGLCEEGRQVVLVTHHLEDLELVPALTHVLELRAGRAVYQGPRAGWSGGVLHP
jgi:molybdate transport system ATP-binding protein